MLHNVPSAREWHKDVPSNANWPVRLGIALILFWGVGFGMWATLAPLEGAVVSQGTFVATGQNKQVQHLEGGIVREILVAEGSLVEPGQSLLKLEDTAAKARLRRLQLRALRLSAMKARLTAEAKGATEWRLPDEPYGLTDEEVKEVVDSQVAELQARISKRQDEESVLRKEIASLNETIEGFRAQANATQRQLTLFESELKDKQELYERQLVRRAELLGLERSEARLGGELGQLMSRVTDAQERVSRAEQQIAQMRSAAIQKAIEELRATETELDDISEQIRAAKDIVERTEIVSPVRGIVVKMHHHTPGGVVASGATLLELLPINDELIIETRVLPSDISQVKEGQKAQVRISGVNQRIVPMIDATVTYVSADAVVESDPRRMASAAQISHGAFVVRVQIDMADLKAKARDFRPGPGMPADVFIKTEQRTFADYILKPLRDSMSHAFRET
jgi:HlyD family type I secretion membrane fusion protein